MFFAVKALAQSYRNLAMADVELVDGPRRYYAEVMKPGYDEFFESPSSFRTAFNLASSLFHFHEWLYVYCRAKLETHYKALKTPQAFWATVEATNLRFGFIRDLANASKHVCLTKRPSTSMTHVANTHIRIGTFQRGAFDPRVFDTGGLVMQDGATEVSFDACATELFNYWTRLMNDIGLIARQPNHTTIRLRSRLSYFSLAAPYAAREGL
jgi:hypothetical protein